MTVAASTGNLEKEKKKKGRDYLNIEGIALSQLPSVVSLDILNLLRVFIPSSCHETLHQCFQI